MKITKLFGIDIKISLPGFILLALCTIQVSTYLMKKGYDGPSCLILGFASAIFIIGSVVIHELGHSLVAQKFGMSVEEIEINLLGGVAKLLGAFPSAKGEFLIAIAGPLVSAACAVLLFGLSTLLIQAELAYVVISLLCLVNVMMFLFNLLPLFPLDGGRILRSSIWYFTDNFVQSTKIAAFVGMLGGGYFILTGLLSFVGINISMFGTPGVWNILIGGFIILACSQEVKQNYRPKVSIPDKEARFRNQELE